MLEDEEALAAGLDATRPPKRFLPFAAGLRNCIGQNLAKMNAHATLAVLLSRFSFQLPAEVRPGGPDTTGSAALLAPNTCPFRTISCLRCYFSCPSRMYDLPCQPQSQPFKPECVCVPARDPYLPAPLPAAAVAS
jgi:hypothetical protein